MPDATEFEWLVQFTDIDKRTAFERFATVDEAIPFLHKILGTGQRPRLYRETPITLKIDVGGEAPVKAPRKRRKNSPLADKPGSDTPTGPGNGAAGGLKGAASPSSLRVNGREESEVRVADPTAPHVLASVYSCEARFANDPACPGPAALDPVTRGWFCPLHIGIPDSIRREFHAIHRERNRPVRVAHAG